MDTSKHERLAKVLADCDVGWILDVAENRDRQLKAIAELVADVSRQLEITLDKTPVDLLSELEADLIVLTPLVRLLPFAVSSGMSYQQKVAVNLRVRCAIPMTVKSECSSHALCGTLRFSGSWES